VEYDRTKLNFFEKQEEVWIVEQTGHASHHNFVGVAVSEEGSRQLPGLDPHKASTSTKVILYRPSLAPIYGGPTLLEALWNEMDVIMERLMTKQESEDGGDKFRAQELAWVLAIVTNAYNPSVDMIRAEAVRRYREVQ
jgi:hypothetical protein